MKQKCNLDLSMLFAQFEQQEVPFDVTLKSKSAFYRALKRTPCEKRIQKEQETKGEKTSRINGFMVSEALLALLICSISGFLVLASSGALSKAMQMDVQSEMDVDFDLDIERYD